MKGRVKENFETESTFTLDVEYEGLEVVIKAIEGKAQPKLVFYQEYSLFGIEFCPLNHYVTLLDSSVYPELDELKEMMEKGELEKFQIYYKTKHLLHEIEKK